LTHEQADQLASVSDYTYAHCWDAQLWRGDLLTDVDHLLAPDALDTLAARLTALPTTYGWAMNQGCDAVYRFACAARVAIAVSAHTAVWTAIAAPDLQSGHTLAHLVGANP
jgi:hypothetical protein